MTNADVALSLARSGFFVFPCYPDKSPAIGAWRENSTNDPNIVFHYWFGRRGALAGLDCGKSNLLVIDCDRHGGPDGVKAFADLCRKYHQPFDELVSVTTMNGGRHVIFRQPENETFGCRRGELPSGIDVKGSGGFIIAPGTQTADGRCYKLNKSLSLIRPLPAWIAALIRAPHKVNIPDAGHRASLRANERELAYGDATLSRITAELSAMSRGSRNDALNRAAFRLGGMCARGWIDRNMIIRALMQAADANGLAQEDGHYSVMNTIESGLTAGERAPCRDLPVRAA